MCTHSFTTGWNHSSAPRNFVDQLMQTRALDGIQRSARVGRLCWTALYAGGSHGRPIFASVGERHRAKLCWKNIIKLYSRMRSAVLIGIVTGGLAFAEVTCVDPGIINNADHPGITSQRNHGSMHRLCSVRRGAP